MKVKAMRAQTRSQLLQLSLGASHMRQVTLYQHGNAFQVPPRRQDASRRTLPVMYFSLIGNGTATCQRGDDQHQHDRYRQPAHRQRDPVHVAG